MNGNLSISIFWNGRLNAFSRNLNIQVGDKEREMLIKYLLLIYKLMIFSKFKLKIICLNI